MSHSIGLVEARNSWQRILADQQGDLGEVYSPPEVTADEIAFRDKFFALPRDFHVRDPDFNYGLFVRYHEKVLSFVQELDQIFQLETPHALGDVFWSAAYLAVKVSILLCQCK